MNCHIAMRLMNEGLSIAEIAEELNLSEVHVKRMIRDERKRLGLAPARFIKGAFPLPYAGRPDTTPEWGTSK